MSRLFLPLFGCLSFILLSGTTGCGQQQKATESPASTIENTQKPTPATTMEQPLQAPVPDPKPKNAKVRIITNYGTMVIRLYDETPAHRDNFLMLAEKGFYNKTLFHRCIKNFMIQGGDPDSKGAPAGKPLGMGGPGYTVEAEFRPAFVHKKGALAAARQGDGVNPQRRSSGSQFYIVQGSVMTDGQIAQVQAYINQKTPGFAYTEEQKNIYKTIGGTAQLDMDYTVFGEVIEGLDVIDKIASQATASGDRPVEDIAITVEIVK